MNIRSFVSVALLASAAAYAQPNATLDTQFQIRYASNLAAGDSVINITNSGASGAQDPLLPPTGTSTGNLCVNVYAYTPDEQLAACCSCLVTPNGLNSLSVRSDLASNPLTPVVPSSMVIKLLASTPQAGVCNPANPIGLAPGMLAWGTTLHPLPVTPGSPATTYFGAETPFSPATLSDGEQTRMTQLCGFLRANGSGYGICKSCKLGGLGSAAK